MTHLAESWPLSHDPGLYILVIDSEFQFLSFRSFLCTQAKDGSPNRADLRLF